MMKKLMIGVGGLVTIGLMAMVVWQFAPRAAAEAVNGLSPFTALPLRDGRNSGLLAPGESRWYAVGGGSDGAFQRRADLTLFFTPEDGNRAYRVSFQIFPADQIGRWYQGDASQMNNVGAGGVVSRDGNPLTGELLWSGWLMGGEAYYVQVSNGTDVAIDYHLFTGDIVGAELGPSTEPTLPAEADPAPSPTAQAPTEADSLLPLASESASGRPAVPAEAGTTPAGMPTRLIVPAIALDSAVVPVGWEPTVVDGVTYHQWKTADNLVGWHSLSAKLGQVGNTVLNGHSDVNAAIFRDLKHVGIGDEITIFSGDRVYTYTVAGKFVVQEEGISIEERLGNARWIAWTQDERLTLVTCANPGATHRLIVVARPARNGG